MTAADTFSRSRAALDLLQAVKGHRCIWPHMHAGAHLYIYSPDLALSQCLVGEAESLVGGTQSLVGET